MYGRTVIAEEFSCNFGLNPEFRDVMQRGGLHVTGSDESGEARIVELPDHPFFVATMFLPQLADPGTAHPLIVAFLEASSGRTGMP